MDERLTDEKVEYMIHVMEQYEGVAAHPSEVLVLLRELKSARKRIAELTQKLQDARDDYERVLEDMDHFRAG